MPRKSSPQSATGQQEMLLPGANKRKPPPHLPEKTAPQRIFVALMPGMQAAVRACSVAENISHVLSEAGVISSRPGGFTPHMTLFYHQRQTPIETSWLDEPIVWRAGGFRLIESFYGQTRYVNHGDWPLSLDHG